MTDACRGVSGKSATLTSCATSTMAPTIGLILCQTKDRVFGESFEPANAAGRQSGKEG